MNYISTDYDTLDDTQPPYDDAFVQRWADELQIDANMLQTALEKAFGEYLSLKIYCHRYEHWYQAREQFKSIHKALTRSKELWKRVPAGNREAFDLFAMDRMCFADVEAQLNDIHDVVDELLWWGERPRGNQGRSRATGDLDVDLEPLQNFTTVMHDFWHENVDGPFGIRTEDNYEAAPTDDPDASVWEPKSRGIRFLHACLQKLEPGIDATTCQTLMRKMRAKQSRA